MIDNFTTIKSQLKELAPLINEFKSEQVQLRLIEIIFDKEMSEKEVGVETENIVKKRKKAKRSKKIQNTKNTKIKNTSQPSSKTASKRSSSRKGPVFHLTQLIDEGYFDQPRHINTIVEYLKVNKAIIYKTNELSTPLARLVRTKRLKREENAEKQYEYKKTK